VKSTSLAPGIIDRGSLATAILRQNNLLMPTPVENAVASRTGATPNSPVGENVGFKDPYLPTLYNFSRDIIPAISLQVTQMPVLASTQIFEQKSTEKAQGTSPANQYGSLALSPLQGEPLVNGSLAGPSIGLQVIVAGEVQSRAGAFNPVFEATYLPERILPWEAVPAGKIGSITTKQQGINPFSGSLGALGLGGGLATALNALHNVGHFQNINQLATQGMNAGTSIPARYFPRNP